MSEPELDDPAFEQELRRILGPDADAELVASTGGGWKTFVMIPMDGTHFLAWLRTVPTGIGTAGFEEHVRAYAKVFGVDAPRPPRDVSEGS